MSKLFQSPLRTFVTIAVAWFLVGGFALSFGFAFGVFDLGGHDTGLDRFGNMLIDVFFAMSVPFDAPWAAVPTGFLLAVLFWASVLTAVLWAIRAFNQRIRQS